MRLTALFLALVLVAVPTAGPAAAGEWYEALEASTIVYAPNVNQNVADASNGGARAESLEALKTEIREEVQRASVMKMRAGVAPSTDIGPSMGKSVSVVTSQGPNINPFGKTFLPVQSAQRLESDDRNGNGPGPQTQTYTVTYVVSYAQAGVSAAPEPQPTPVIAAESTEQG